MWYDERCIVEDPVHGSARDCLRACPENASTLYGRGDRAPTTGMKIDRRRCMVCGKCAQACPSAVLEVLGRSIREALPTIERRDLLAYTNLAKPKYHRLDLPYTLEDALLLTHAEAETVWQVAVELVPVVKWSGATRYTCREG